MRNTILTVFIFILIILFSGISTYFLINNLSARRALKGLDEKYAKEIKERLGQEKEAIRGVFQKEYQPKMSEFETKAKALQLEREKTKELEEKLKILEAEKAKEKKPEKKKKSWFKK